MCIRVEKSRGRRGRGSEGPFSLQGKTSRKSQLQKSREGGREERGGQTSRLSFLLLLVPPPALKTRERGLPPPPPALPPPLGCESCAELKRWYTGHFEFTRPPSNSRGSGAGGASIVVPGEFLPSPPLSFTLFHFLRSRRSRNNFSRGRRS